MIQNYIKTAIRTLQKNKGFTAINVFGLALGLATCMLIVFYVFDERSYDKYNTKADRIYRVDSEIKYGGKSVACAIEPAPLAATLSSDFPEVEEAVRIMHNGSFHIKKAGENINEEMVYADPALFDVFTLPMIYGNSKSALADPFTAVLTESTARKYFRKVNVIGQTILVNDSIMYKITGVIKDIPVQSHFNFGFFLSMSSSAETRANNNNWLASEYNTYVLIKPGADLKRLEAKLPQVIRKNVGSQLQSVMNTSFDSFEKSGNYFRLNLTPLTDIHLGSTRDGELGINGNLQYVYIFSAIGLFILLIACVNFINLSTARSSNRAREVGVRKTLGSSRNSLIAQFLAESYIITLLATAIALFLAAMLLPFFNQLAGKQLFFSVHLLIRLLPALLGVVAFVGFLAGFYPAVFLSSFKPTDVLKGKLSTGFKGGGLRSFLVVFQFGISIFLIIITLVVYNQLHYIQTKNIGYNRNQVLVIQNVSTLGNRAELLKQELKELRDVKNATLSGFLPTSDYRNSGSLFKTPTLDQKSAIKPEIWPVDEDYISTLGMKLIRGRNFSPQMKTDSTALIINEAAAVSLGFTNPINKSLYYLYLTNMTLRHVIKYHIIGVVKDFHYSSLKDNINPLVMRLAPDRTSLSLRINTAHLPALISQVGDKWKSFAPSQQFSYSFMDHDFDALYRSEQRIGTLSIVFTSLAIIIACLGLFGLAAYAAEQRSKEIGIRKVLGANMSAIIRMLSFDFIKLVLIAIVLASPLAWWAMNKWLQEFAYRQNIQWWILALAGGAAVLIAFLTISFQSIKAALTNPVESLRSE